MKYEPTREEYQEYVEEMTPKYSCIRHCIQAFVVGGAICTLGQILKELYMGSFHLKEDTALSYVTLTLILISVLLTGWNIFGKIADFAGAGTLVPITGFANSVAAPAIEFQKEGQVFGIGVKLFTIAGPVILYGIFSSWCLGLIYWLFW